VAHALTPGIVHVHFMRSYVMSQAVSMDARYVMIITFPEIT